MDIKGIGDRCDRLCFVYALCAKNYIFTSFVFLLVSSGLILFIIVQNSALTTGVLSSMVSAVGSLG